MKTVLLYELALLFTISTIVYTLFPYGKQFCNKVVTFGCYESVLCQKGVEGREIVLGQFHRQPHVVAEFLRQDAAVQFL